MITPKQRDIIYTYDITMSREHLRATRVLSLAPVLERLRRLCHVEQALIGDRRIGDDRYCVVLITTTPLEDELLSDVIDIFDEYAQQAATLPTWYD